MSVLERASRISQDLQKPIKVHEHIIQTEYELDGKVHQAYAEWDRDYELPINPPLLDNEWILQNRDDVQGVNDVLEGQRQGIELSILDFENSPIAKQYGVESALRPTAARILSYAILHDEYVQAEQQKRQRAKAIRDEYDAKKDDLDEKVKRKQLKNSARVRTVKSLQESYFPQIRAFEEQAANEQTMAELVMRKATLDMLGLTLEEIEAHEQGENQTTKLFNLPHALGEAYDVQGQRHAQDNNQFVTRFISDLTKYLRTTKDPAIFNQYRYKYTDGLSSNYDDCSHLDALLSFEHDAGAYTTDPRLLQAINQLGQASLTFLANRSSFLSNTGLRIAQYPQLEIIYDVINAGLAGGRARVVHQLPTTIDKYFYTEQKRRSIENEVADVSGLFVERLLSYIDQYPDVMHALKLQQAIINSNKDNPQLRIMRPQIDPSKNYNVEMPEEIVSFVSSDIGRYMTAFGVFGELAEKNFKHPLKRSEAIQRISQGVIEGQRRVATRDELIEIVLLYKGVNTIGTNLYSERGITMDIGNSLMADNSFTASFLPERTKREATSTRQKIKAFTEYSEELRNISSAHHDSAILVGHNMHFFDQSELLRKEQDYIRENEYLLRKVVDEFEWFVSPRGDLFPSDRDPELEEKGIEYIKFRMDRAHPREYASEIRFSGIDEPLTLWLDTHKRLLDSAHSPLLLDVRYKQALQNMLLRRLAYITSGLLSQDQEEHDSEYEEGPAFTYRRACFVTLLHEKFHMQSEQARQHALDLWNQFRINLKKEQTRRRDAGIIPPHAHLTFRRETVPDVQDRNIVSNVINYRPDLIQDMLIQDDIISP